MAQPIQQKAPTAQELFRHHRPMFCDDAKTWLGKRRSVKLAWEVCPNGNWMAYWLLTIHPGGVGSVERRTLWRQFQALANTIPGAYSGAVYSGNWWTPEAKQTFANMIRALYNYDGTRRSK